MTKKQKGSFEFYSFCWLNPNTIQNIGATPSVLMLKNACARYPKITIKKNVLFLSFKSPFKFLSNINVKKIK